MAAKPKKDVEVKDEAESKAPVNVANQPPAGATQEDISPRVVCEPDKSFDERTAGNNQPWLNDKGEQVTGEGDTTEADKAE